MGDGVDLTTPTGTASTEEITKLRGGTVPAQQIQRVIPSTVEGQTAIDADILSLRDMKVAQRYTTPAADSLADGISSGWSTTGSANGGGASSSGGAGVILTSASATGIGQLQSPVVTYMPGQVTWFNSAVRFNDTGSAGNTRRIGLFTVSGTTPQNGAYFELTSAGLYAVICKAGTPTAVLSTSWSEVADAPFTGTLTDYASYEIRITANNVQFWVSNVKRHEVSGTNTELTQTLNFPITIQSINTSGATDRQIVVRNCGIGRFGSPMRPVEETGLNAVHAIAMGGGTPHDSIDSGYPLKIGGYASAAAPTSVGAADRVNAWFLLNGAQATVLTAAGALIGGDAANGLDVDVTNVVPGTGATNLGKAEDAAHTTGDVGVMVLGVRSAIPSERSAGPTDGDYEPFATNEVGAQWVTLTPSSNGGASTMNASSGDGSTALTNTAQAIKGSAGVLTGYSIYNPNATVAYVIFYNTASGSVTVGTTNPLFIVAVPPASALNIAFTYPIGFTTAMSWAATAAAATNAALGTALEATAWFK